MLNRLLGRMPRGDDPRSSNRQTAACPQCHATGTFLVASTDRNRQTTAAVFEYFQCQSCQLVFMDPVPDDLRPYYAGGYREIPATVEELCKIAEPEAHRLEPVLQYKTSGKLLEIGPWMGVFSFNAKRAGFDVTAIEMDQDCVDFLNDKVGVRAIQSTDPAATLDSMQEQFDVIALWHCLEHLRKPWLVIERAAQRLAPGGILLIAIPNIESYEFKLLHAAWINLDAPRHIYFFPRVSLRNTCSAIGLSERLYTTTDPLSLEFSANTWHHVALRVVSFPILRRVFRRWATAAANRRALLENSGPGMTAVYQHN